MPWLEIDHLQISPDVWAKLLDKHGLEPGPLRDGLLAKRRHRFEWIIDRRGRRSKIEYDHEGVTLYVILWPRVGAPADHWNLATAYPP